MPSLRTESLAGFDFHWTYVILGAVCIIAIEFWGPLYYNYNKEPPEIVIGNYLGPYSKQCKRELPEGAL